MNKWEWENIHKHPLAISIGIVVITASITWAVEYALYVTPRNEKILDLEDRIRAIPTPLPPSTPTPTSTVTPTATPTPTVACDGVDVVIPDKVLNRTLRARFPNKDMGAALTDCDLKSLDSVQFMKGPVANLEGLQYCTNVNQLLLIGQPGIKTVKELSTLTKMISLDINKCDDLEDITSLANLKMLNRLYIEASHVSDLTPLANLTMLTDLRIGSCLVSDLTPLKNLKRLETLHVRESKVSNIDALEYLPNLQHVVLDHNQITDISPLLHNPKIDRGDVVGLDANPLSEKSVKEQIELLKDRQVDVIFKH